MCPCCCVCVWHRRKTATTISGPRGIPNSANISPGHRQKPHFISKRIDIFLPSINLLQSNIQVIWVLWLNWISLRHIQVAANEKNMQFDSLQRAVSRALAAFAKRSMFVTLNIPCGRFRFDVDAHADANNKPCSAQPTIQQFACIEQELLFRWESTGLCG